MDVKEIVDNAYQRIITEILGDLEDRIEKAVSAHERTVVVYRLESELFSELLHGEKVQWFRKFFPSKTPYSDAWKSGRITQDDALKFSPPEFKEIFFKLTNVMHLSPYIDCISLYPPHCSTPEEEFQICINL